MRSWARRFGSGILVFAWLPVVGCHRAAPSPQDPAATDDAPVARTPGLPWFEDVTAASGIDFQHFDSTTPMNYMPEMMGSGLGWIDYDNDGWLDLFCVQDGPLRPGAAAG